MPEGSEYETKSWPVEIDRERSRFHEYRDWLMEVKGLPYDQAEEQARTINHGNISGSIGSL